MSAAWEASARCREIGPDLFEPSSYTKQDVAEAKKICARCPVRKPCLADALHREAGLPQQSRATVRGGLTPRERTALDPKRREAAA
ncbi:WhiB family transcriptional regulator [Streptomyces sp. URMC 124]|uniref:WhiB family transcriptional regulator n=1 Tax=Streptomyces sp. URMC 124 TaxID=3423405 RepID=UPI003F19E8E5